MTAGHQRAQDAASAAVGDNDNDTWPAAGDANDAWAPPQHANSPAMDSNTGVATDIGWGDASARGWEDLGGSGGTAGNWPSTAAPPQPEGGRKLKKKDKKSGASKVSFALGEPSAATPTVHPPPGPPQHQVNSSIGWESPSETDVGQGDYYNYNGGPDWEDGYAHNPAQGPAATPAVGMPAQSAWLGWAAEAKGLPQVTTTSAHRPPPKSNPITSVSPPKSCNVPRCLTRIARRVWPRF